MTTLDPIDIGSTPNDGTGDTLRDAFSKVNTNEANINSDVGQNTNDITAVEGDITDLQNDKADKVIPAAVNNIAQLDATGNLADSGAQLSDFVIQPVDSINFSPIAPPAYLEGKLFYDNTKNALSYYNENSQMTVNISQEVLFPVVNNSGATIPNGAVVTPDSTGIILADRHEKDRSRLIAVATTEMTDGASGYVTRLGQVGGLDTSTYTAGQILYLGNEGAFATAPPDDGSYTVIVGVVDVVDASEGIITVDVNVSDLTVEVTDTNGFPPDQRAGSTLSVNEGTRTFTITPDGADLHFYERGDKYEITAPDSIVFSNDEGEHWFYYADGVLTTTFNPSSAQKESIILNNAFIAGVYWDTTNNEVVIDIQDERHGISMSPYTHLYLHLTRGAQWISGFGLDDFNIDAGGSLDVDAQFSVSSGVYFDEDIDHNETGKAVGDTIPVVYIEGTSIVVREGTQAGFSVLNAPAGRLYYNDYNGGDWQLTEISDNDFVLYHIFGFNGQTVNTISVMGQNDYATLGAARTGAATEIASLISVLLLVEMIPIATVIYQTRNSYTNTVKARIRSTDDGADYIDWRTTELAQGAAPTSHANLTNVDAAGLGVEQGHINTLTQIMEGNKLFTNGVTVDPNQTYLPSNGLAFSPNLLFYASALNTLTFQRGGVDIFGFTSVSISSNGRASLMTALPTRTTAVLRTWMANNAGIGGLNDASEFSLITDGAERVRIDEGLIIDPNDNSTALNGLKFGDVNLAFYRSTGNTLALNVAGAFAWEFTSAAIQGIYVQILKGEPTDTTATIRLRQNENTGLGSNASTQLSLIADSVEAVRVRSNKVIFMENTVVNLLTTNLSNPPTQAELDAAYGTAASNGAGYTVYVDENNNNNNVYMIISTGTSWHIFESTKAS